jgi:hypothetical protein
MIRSGHHHATFPSHRTCEQSYEYCRDANEAEEEGRHGEGSKGRPPRQSAKVVAQEGVKIIAAARREQRLKQSILQATLATGTATKTTALALQRFHLGAPQVNT